MQESIEVGARAGRVQGALGQLARADPAGRQRFVQGLDTSEFSVQWHGYSMTVGTRNRPFSLAGALAMSAWRRGSVCVAPASSARRRNVKDGGPSCGEEGGREVEN